jgi:isopentenyl-diphosphate Delta-isomerase
VELKRANKKNDFFEEWGLPTSYCVRKVNELKKDFHFMLIASGGINDGTEIAKAIALGADLTASARIILKELVKHDVEGVVNLIDDWFLTVKNIMYLTNCSDVYSLGRTIIKKKEELY